jgi:hypothetical protein
VPFVTWPPKTYQCPTCKPDDPFPEVVVLHGALVPEDWDGRMPLQCPYHGEFFVQVQES